MPYTIKEIRKIRRFDVDVLLQEREELKKRIEGMNPAGTALDHKTPEALANRFGYDSAIRDVLHLFND